jgi:transaldolase
MHKEGLPSILKHYVDICNLVDGDAEVNALDYDGTIKEGEELAIITTDCCKNCQ